MKIVIGVRAQRARANIYRVRNELIGVRCRSSQHVSNTGAELSFFAEELGLMLAAQSDKIPQCDPITKTLSALCLLLTLV